MSTTDPAGGRDPRMPVSPQLALRVAILGGLAMALFAIVFFRLWFLQVLSGEQYVQQADANRVRDLPIAAPRGQILDRDGRVLVSSKTTNAVQMVPSELPAAVTDQALAYQAALGKAETRYRDATLALARFEHAHATSSGRVAASERRELDLLKAEAHPPAVPVPPLPASAV